MPIFDYRGRDRMGGPVTGQMEATSPEAVADRLTELAVIPVDIRPASAHPVSVDELIERFTKPRIKTGDLVFFSRQMHTLLRASVPLIDALRGLSRSSSNPTLSEVINQMLKSLEAGTDFTSALRNHPRVFSPLYVSMVQVGETSGSLPQVFEELSKYLQQEDEIRGRVKAAIRYPSFVIAAIVIAMIIVNIFVIPAFADMFRQFGADLPLVTRIMMGVSDFMLKFWYLALGSGAGAFYALRLYLRTDDGQYQWDRLKIRLPVIGSILFRGMLTRFTRSLAITTSAGIPMVQGLPIAISALGNSYVQAQVGTMRESLEAGESITTSAERTGLFPQLVVQMISVGEDSGTVDQMMDEVADYYEREVTYAVDGLASSIEPILILVVGGMMLLVATAVFLPMWDMMAAARGG